MTVRNPRRIIETPIWCKDDSVFHRNRIRLKSDEFNRLIDQLNVYVAHCDPPSQIQRG